MNAADTGPQLALDIGARETMITAATGVSWTLPVGTGSLWPLTPSGPSARGTGFDDAAGDAVLLILRELMHHLGVRSLHGPD